MSEPLYAGQLKISLDIIDGALHLFFTCPRCDTRQSLRVKTPTSRLLLPADQEYYICANPDCQPSIKNMSFEPVIKLAYSSHQGRNDVPVRCVKCEKRYCYDCKLNFAPQCRCKEES